MGDSDARISFGFVRSAAIYLVLFQQILFLILLIQVEFLLQLETCGVSPESAPDVTTCHSFLARKPGFSHSASDTGSLKFMEQLYAVK